MTFEELQARVAALFDEATAAGLDADERKRRLLSLLESLDDLSRDRHELGAQEYLEKAARKAASMWMGIEGPELPLIQ